MQIPEERLVYSHCSSIFTGTNAKVRKLKNVRQILLNHKASIKGLLDEFDLENVSVVAKKLLKERVFQSLRRAQLRFPDSFQRSEAGEVGGTVPEAEVVSFETEAEDGALGTSEDDHGYSPIDGHGKHDGSLRIITPEEVSPRSRRPSAEQRQVILPATFSRKDHVAQLIHHSDPNTIIDEPSSDPLWRLHPIYIPFRTQHRILTFTQSTLEACCRDFGQTWVPHLMKANKWDEPESIELTEWIKKFSKCTRGLPPSATRSIAGKSLNQVLFDTTTLRHRAVHRNPTNVEGIKGMLHAAHDFALALKDSARAALIKTIEDQLAASVNILFQDQGLLQQNVSGQLEVTAKGRTELDKLERFCTTNVRGYGDVQRTEAASAIKDGIADPQRDSNLRSLNHGGEKESTVSVHATPEARTLKTEPQLVANATGSPFHFLNNTHSSTTTTTYPHNIAQTATTPEHELPPLPIMLSAELITPLLSFISRTRIAMLGYGYGVLGWEREGVEDSTKANGKEEDSHDDFHRFL